MRTADLFNITGRTGNELMSVHLVLGGARSGKSRYAESRVTELSQGKDKHYVATAIAFDEEMTKRIVHHQRTRGVSWREHECPIELAQLLSKFKHGDVVLIDCLTLWLNNVIYNDGLTLGEEQIKKRVEELQHAVSICKAEVVLVSNEVGLGVVPLGEVSRLFVDHAGWMNQALALVADRVTLVTAGLPLELKQPDVV